MALPYPINDPSNIPYAPKLNTTRNIMLKIMVKIALTKLPKAYFLVSPTPLAICRKKETKIYAIKFITKKTLYLF